ncbi:Bacterial regulatory protein, luxR family [Planctomycetes bacterium MalM25]|nr:Bacterial regulatory protein, luxR family [Planctomycetes bacterium MalM25]
MEETREAPSDSLSEADVRRIASLACELAGTPGSLVPKRRYLFDGLADAINASHWLWARRLQDAPSGEPRYAGLLHEGFAAEGLQSLAAAAAHPDIKKVEAGFRDAIARSDRQVTLRLEDYTDLTHWQTSPVRELIERAGVGVVMSSARRLGEKSSSSVVAFYRGLGAKPFSPRDRLLVDVVLDGADWVHADDGLQESEAIDVAGLPRRHMVLLSLLIHGNSRQEIATLMELSINTVNSYTKTLFKHFGVQSQPELMQAFIHGKATSGIPAGPQLSD